MRHFLIALVAGSAVMLSGCRRSTPADAASAEAVSVTVDAARVGTLRDAVTATGTVTPSPAGDLTIYASEPATIAELSKKEQDPVAAGDLLVRLDIPAVAEELAATQLAVVGAQAAVDRAKAELARQTSLFERGITPRVAFDNSKADVSAAESAWAQVKSRQDALQAGPDRAVVRAHFPGIVAHVWHALGDAVRPGNDDPIIRVIDPSRVQVSAQVPIAQLGRVAPGQTATIQGLGNFEPEGAQVIAKLGSQDPNSATGEVRLSFLKPTMLPVDTPVTAAIEIDQRSGAVIVASATVRRDPQGSYVMVAGDDQRAHRRDVRIGLVTKDQVQVIAGVSAGERVIVASIGDLADGSPIVVSR